MRGHLQCRDTLAGNEGCPLKTGTTVSCMYMNLISEPLLYGVKCLNYSFRD